MTTFPKISIVTPSFNQGKYLEKTILSVIGQGYPNLEYIIIDGGSTDESVEIIRRYEKHLAYWVSEPDRGQSHAINKGFERATGEIFGWLNSDDWYHPGALMAVAEAFAANPDAGAVVGAGDMLYEETGRAILVESFSVTPESLYRSVLGQYFMQPSCFFTRMAWEACGPLDESLHLAMDTDLWLSIASKHRFATVSQNLSTTIVHPNAKTTARAAESYADGLLVIERRGGHDEAREQLVTLISELLESRTTTAQLHADLQKMHERLVSLEAEKHRADVKLNDLTSENVKLKQLFQQAFSDNQRILSSVSWKITAPLRKIIDLVTAKR